MRRLTAFANGWPLSFAILSFVGSLAVQMMVGSALGRRGLNLTATAGGWVVYEVACRGVMIALAVALLRGLGWTSESGFRALEPGTWPILWLPATIALFELRDVEGSVRAVLGGTIAAAAVGLCEEAWFRGVILRALRPGGEMRAAILSALLFATAHLGWLFWKWPVTSVVFMFCYTFADGLLWAALVIRTRSIWPVVAFHTVIDAGAFSWELTHAYRELPHPSPHRIAFHAVLMFYGLYLLSTRADPEAAPPAVAA